MKNRSKKIKYVSLMLLALSTVTCARADIWNLIKGGTRFGAAALLFTNYAIMRALVIPHAERDDIKQELDDHKKLKQVYTFYKNASLVCGLGLLLPARFPQPVRNYFYKYW
ncbi:hypothetical protein Noda2021_01020 [Candidatus Dependentiae bacterium Noda2021]|nr:hypothetical protein Noda2021_01020 [Candidatus Dependentiae bacterium Noda2021]